ncbi:MAG: DMT family transporter [Acidimicrobiales bacterium]
MTSRPPVARRASLALVLAAFLWGSTFVVVQDAVEDASILAFLAVRFLIAAVVLWPLVRRRPASPLEVRHGVAAGSLFLLGYVFQTAGLQYTTSSSSAFITYLLVVFVPVIDVVVTRRPPPPLVLTGVALAVVGLILLSGGVSGFGRGEWLTLVCALCFAAHLVLLDRVTTQHDPVRLTFWQVLTVGAVCLVPGFGSGGYGFGWTAWVAAAFTGVGATAIAVLCMVWAQRVVPPARTAVAPVGAGVRRPPRLLGRRPPRWHGIPRRGSDPHGRAADRAAAGVARSPRRTPPRRRLAVPGDVAEVPTERRSACRKDHRPPAARSRNSSKM